MKQYRPDNVNQIGEMYFALGYVEMQLAEIFCNGMPFGSSVEGVPVYGAPNTDAAVLALASAHLDTALSFLDPTTSLSAPSTPPT